MLLQKIIEELNLYEGLEITHEISQVIHSLNTWCDFNGRIAYRNDRGCILMRVSRSITKSNFDHVLKMANSYGYFPSAFITSWHQEKFNYERIVSFLNNDVAFDVTFDPKYDPQIADVDLPDYGYHITPSKSEEKILKIGLAPRSKEKLSKHPERIYFTAFLNDVEDLLQSNKFTNKEPIFTIFQFDLKKLKQKRVIRFFSDPVYPNKGFYTYENIPPQYLKVVKRIKSP